MSRARIEACHPRLKRTPYALTSPETNENNCIAWAVGDVDRWWWPFQGVSQAYWPPGVARDETLAAFIAAFATQGFAPCADGRVELGFERIAVFTDPNGKPTHAAKQVPGGRWWSSKLGPLEDISHILYGLEGPPYGTVTQYLRRPIPAPAAAL